ncbi:MAG: hypothetical protein B6I17_03605 [Tenericutes bacterium 4572_104]|nr:MAG: hypothetical protein B6I17_03605 [Tenericutes bacterium 4572_104]
MSALKVELRYNPYTVDYSVFVDNKDSSDEFHDWCKNKRLQTWIDQFLLKLIDFYNTRKIELTYIGTALDSEDVKDAINLFLSNHSEIEIILELNVNDEPIENKIFKLKELYKNAKSGPFEEFQTTEMDRSFNKALDPEFEVNVIATMSSGKSTVINSMLGLELMPAKNEACTATIAKIEDCDEMDDFKSRRFDQNENLIDDWCTCNIKLLEKWNDDPETSRIHIKGDIPGIHESEGVKLVLVDTPGPNNSRNTGHRKITESIMKNQLSMVLYILNSTQLSTEDDKSLLNLIKEAMALGGREAQDRFIFLANKIDAFDPENGESVARALDNTRKYLEDNGIKNPLVIPVSAHLAKLVRIVKYNGIDSLRRLQKADLDKYVSLFVEEEEMNMLNHVKDDISLNIYNKLNNSLKKANDANSKAEILSGIPIVESLLDNFISKHAIPAKLKDAVDSFESVMTKAEGIKKLNSIIEKDENDLEQLSKKIEAFVNDKERLKKADNFRKRVQQEKYEISANSSSAIKGIQKNSEALITKVEDKFKEKVELKLAEEIFENTEEKVNRFMSDIQLILDENLGKDFMNKLEDLKVEYDNYVADVLKNSFPDDDDFEIKELQKNTLQLGSINTLIKGSAYDEDVKVGTEKVWQRSWNPLSWFFKKTVNVYEERTFTNMVPAYKELEANLRTFIQKNIKEFHKTSDIQFNDAKGLLIIQMDIIDKRIDENMKDILRLNDDKSVKERIIRSNKSKIEWYDNFKINLSEILKV